jgi:hypothetical protein
MMGHIASVGMLDDSAAAPWMAWRAWRPPFWVRRRVAR